MGIDKLILLFDNSFQTLVIKREKVNDQRRIKN
jgi:hypothetical protein